MNVIPVIIYAAELAVAAIILFYVVEMLTMPVNMKRVCQGLIVLDGHYLPGLSRRSLSSPL
jgi:hypothetical protein